MQPPIGHRLSGALLESWQPGFRAWHKAGRTHVTKPCRPVSPKEPHSRPSMTAVICFCQCKHVSSSSCGGWQPHHARQDTKTICEPARRALQQFHHKPSRRCRSPLPSQWLTLVQLASGPSLIFFRYNASPTGSSFLAPSLAAFPMFQITSLRPCSTSDDQTPLG